MPDALSLELLGRWREHADQDAAAELFHRYAARLIALARSQMAGKLARRVDADDVAQSVLRSFFVRVRDGRLEVRAGGELWDLLAAITMNKVFGQLEHHTAKKRAIQREQHAAAADESLCLLDIEAIDHDPTPEELVIVAEERDKALQGMSESHRQIVALRLEGYTTTEIAARVGRSDRMVRLVLSDFGKRLQERLARMANS